MTLVDKIINYASILLILLVGVLFLTGVFGILDSTYRTGFGIVIIAYGVIRLAMFYFKAQARGKKP